MLHSYAMSTYETIGMIAGNGIYPITFANAALNAGVKRLVAACFLNETEEILLEKAESHSWFRVGQLGKMIQFFKNWAAFMRPQ